MPSDRAERQNPMDSAREDPWFEAIVPLGEGEEIREGLVNFLMEEGSSGIVVEEGFPLSSKEGFSEGTGGIRIRAFFRNDEPRDARMDRIRIYMDSLSALFPDRWIGDLCLRPLENRDWVQAFRDSFTGTRATGRIAVVPSWIDDQEHQEKGQGQILLKIDPGMAFGTGLHPSTRLCLQALEEEIGRTENPALRVLDVGTGSGILAIAAVKLGAREVLAVDRDAISVRIARENVARNGCKGRIKVLEGGMERVRGRFGLIVANITERVHEENAPSYWKVLDVEGRLILSGILKEQEEGLSRSLRGAGWFLKERRGMEGWSALTLVKSDRMHP